MSIGTRSFPNGLGKSSSVYLGSAELAAICSRLRCIPAKQEYVESVKVLNAASTQIYRYLNFDNIEEYQSAADTVAA